MQLNGGAWGNSGGTAPDIYRVEVPAFRCPSDPTRGPVQEGTVNVGVTNYRACTGDFSFGFMGGSKEPGSTSEVGNARGAFWLEAYQGIEAIVDGTSNTVIWSERCVNPRPGLLDQASKDANSSIAYGHGGYTAWNASAGYGTGGTMQGAFVLGDCLAIRNGSFIKPDNIAISNTQHSGCRWWVGFAEWTLFTTITPPNGPACVGQALTSGAGTGQAAAISPTANHTGGVNVGMGDGSVTFVSDTVNCGPMDARCVISGESQFGVWGAMGSHKGGESKSL